MLNLAYYPLIISESFPDHMSNLGQPTFFINKINAGEKLHTVRINIDYWSKRIEKVMAGDAFLSLRIWSGLAYNSPRIELKRLYSHQVNYEIITYQSYGFVSDKHKYLIPFGVLSQNEGLSQSEFYNWFELQKVPRGAKFIIIHFKPFTYKYLLNYPELDSDEYQH